MGAYFAGALVFIALTLYVAPAIEKAGKEIAKAILDTQPGK